MSAAHEHDRATPEAGDAGPSPLEGGGMTIRIGIFLFDGAEELDWAGPWEILRVWQVHTDDDVEVFTVAQHEGPITCAKGLRVLADHTWATAPPMDVLVYPGGQGTRPHLEDETVLSWLRGQATAGDLLMSVCTGALPLAAAGLLRGRRATTHWSALDLLAGIDETIEVDGDARFVDTGDVITAAGVSAGIDAALHLIVRLAGEERAREVKRYAQYDPRPPV